MNGSGTGFFNSRPPNLGFDDNSISDPDPRLERASNYVVKHKDSVVKVLLEVLTGNDDIPIHAARTVLTANLIVLNRFKIGSDSVLKLLNEFDDFSGRFIEIEDFRRTRFSDLMENLLLVCEHERIALPVFFVPKEFSDNAAHYCHGYRQLLPFYGIFNPHGVLSYPNANQLELAAKRKVSRFGNVVAHIDKKYRDANTPIPRLGGMTRGALQTLLGMVHFIAMAHLNNEHLDAVSRDENLPVGFGVLTRFFGDGSHQGITPGFSSDNVSPFWKLLRGQWFFQDRIKRIALEKAEQARQDDIYINAMKALMGSLPRGCRDAESYMFKF